MSEPQNLLQDISLVYPNGDWPLSVNPRYVVNDPAMSLAEKRSLLASWASDARSVANYPSLRRLDSGALVAIDDVLEALKMLDGTTQRASARHARPTLQRGHWSRLRRGWWRRPHDDEDDDPPSPAPAGIRPLRPIGDGTAELAAA